MMNAKNPAELGTLTFDQFRAIVDGTQPIPDDLPAEVLDLIVDCIDVAESDVTPPASPGR